MREDGVGYSNHMADAGTEVFEQERDLSLAKQMQHTYRNVEVALEKFDDGTYGICSSRVAHALSWPAWRQCQRLPIAWIASHVVNSGDDVGRGWGHPGRSGGVLFHCGHLLFSGIATLALIVDQVTKAWVVAMLSPNETTQLARWLARFYR